MTYPNKIVFGREFVFDNCTDRVVHYVWEGFVLAELLNPDNDPRMPGIPKFSIGFGSLAQAGHTPEIAYLRLIDTLSRRLYLMSDRLAKLVEYRA